MRYVTITTWENADGVDYDVILRSIREKRLPALREMGATRVTLVRTSDRTTAAITEWPDQMTRDAAEAAIEAVRATVHSEDMTRMTGEMRGAVVAEL
jgi:histone H3/H4